MKRVLITGATGFVGWPCLKSLAEAGYEVHAVSSCPAPRDERGATWHRADLLDAQSVARLLQRACPTHLLHLAWYVEPGLYWKSPENFRWVGASLELLRRFHEGGGQRVVMAGTCAEYDWSAGLCDEDTTPLRPATPYGVCKNALREMLQSFAGEAALSWAWGRLFFLYGPGEAPVRLVPSVLSALLRNEPALCSSGEQMRDFLHVEDAARAFVALLESPVQGAVNIASGEVVAIKEVVQTLARLVGRPELLKLGALPASPREPPRIEARVERLRALGWSPRHDLETGLRRTVEHIVAA